LQPLDNSIKKAVFGRRFRYRDSMGSSDIILVKA